MNTKSIVSLLILSILLSGSVVGCRKRLQNTTPLPTGAQTPGQIGGDNPSGIIEMPDVPNPDIIDSTNLAGATLPPGGTPLPNTDRDQWPQDRETFKAYTVYFDFDRSTIKSSEVSKIVEVADMMKAMPGKALRIEGHCDERGTEEYNRALGERRALSVREYLITEGVNADLIETRSYGEDQPADPGQNEAAWAKNRRGEFVVLTPPGTN